MRKVSLQFIAKEAGVSTALVSRVLNNKEVRVSDETRERIIEIAKKNVYIPNRIASGLRTHKTNLIGCIMPRLTTDFFGELVDSISHRANIKGYEVVIYTTQEEKNLERRYLELYKSGIMDGMLINPSDYDGNTAIYQQMIKDEFPFIFVDRYLNHIDASIVSTDGMLSSCRLAKALIKKGHTNILFVAHGYAKKVSVQVERYEGYKQAMLENNLTPQKVYLDPGTPINQQKIFEIMSKQDRPTALCMVSSMDILKVLDMCKELNYRIPGDVEIGTFDRFSLPYSSMEDMKYTRLMEQPPIIIEQNPVKMGEIAVDVLCDKIADPKKEDVKIRLTPSFV